MPRWEMGLIDEVKDKALRITSELIDYINDGYRVVSLVPSCTLMMAHEWPLLHPDNPDIQCLRTHVMDVSAYLVSLQKRHGLTEGLHPLEGISLHMACHARAQNQGRKAEELFVIDS